MSWPPGYGPVGVQQQPPATSAAPCSPSTSEATSNFRSFVSLDGVNSFLNENLDELIEQISRSFSERTASTLRQMGLFSHRKAQALTSAEQHMVVGLAQYIHTSPEPPPIRQLYSYVAKHQNQDPLNFLLKSGVLYQHK